MSLTANVNVNIYAKFCKTSNFKVFKFYIQTCMENMFSKSKIFNKIGAYSYEIKFIFEYE